MLKIKKYLFWLCAMLLAAVFCPGPVLCAQAPQLKFELVLDKAEYGAGDPITVQFSLKNTGKSPVIVNRRFYISDQSVPKDQREVYLEVVSASGEKMACKHFYETGYPKTDYLKTLGPGEETKSDYPRNLRGFFEITEPGTYTVTAVYQNVYGQEIGLDAFKGKLVSEPVKFTVKK